MRAEGLNESWALCAAFDWVKNKSGPAPVRSKSEVKSKATSTSIDSRWPCGEVCLFFAVGVGGGYMGLGGLRSKIVQTQSDNLPTRADQPGIDRYISVLNRKLKQSLKLQ